MNTHSCLSGFGFSIPPEILSNAELESTTEVTDEWIVSRTGIRTRHILAPDMTGSGLALNAVEEALRKSGCAAESITHILYCTCTPDAACPSAACTLAGKLNLPGCMAVDLNAA